MPKSLVLGDAQSVTSDDIEIILAAVRVALEQQPPGGLVQVLVGVP